jgi:ubiquinone/menaquinone biosynthesis C-methylase UbiE
MKLFNSTNKWSNWWKNRKINWKDHYMNPKHPHRILITEVVKRLNWISLIELGCGAGANLLNILVNTKNKQIGGVDINPDAIEEAKKNFTNGLFKVGPGDNVILSDKSTDVILTDMYMIYVSPFKIKKQLTEIKRLARNYVVMCELHSASWWERFVLKWKEGYNMYDWSKVLEKNGFYDIQKYKIPKDFWPESTMQQKYCYIIVAKVPKNYKL